MGGTEQVVSIKKGTKRKQHPTRQATATHRIESRESADKKGTGDLHRSALREWKGQAKAEGQTELKKRQTDFEKSSLQDACPAS